MRKHYLLGVDIGTYESKGVITTVDGKIVNSQVEPHQMIIPQQGWAEHDAEDVWWGDFVAITRRLLEVTGINPDGYRRYRLQRHCARYPAGGR